MATSGAATTVVKSAGSKFVCNAYRNQMERQLRDKLKKKGLLVKIMQANSKRTQLFMDIIKDTNRLNTMSHPMPRTATSATHATPNSTETTAGSGANNNNNNNHNNNNNSSSSRSSSAAEAESFVQQFYRMPKGGPKHSIARKRAHHLTSFLSDYIINAFQSGQFAPPDLPDALRRQADGDVYTFELSSVELLPDLSALKIYWMCSADERVNERVEQYLSATLATQIRTVLTSERVINYVPRVQFVRDESQLVMSQLDKHMAKIHIEVAAAEKAADDDAATAAAAIVAVSSVDNAADVGHVEDSSAAAAVEAAASSSDVKKKSQHRGVTNVYGLDFNRLLDSIRKSYSPPMSSVSGATTPLLEATGQPTAAAAADATLLPWPSPSSSSPKAMTTAVGLSITGSVGGDGGGQLVAAAAAAHASAAPTAFNTRLKAFQINQRQKQESLSKSTIMRLVQLEYEEFAKKEATKQVLLDDED